MKLIRTAAAVTLAIVSIAIVVGVILWGSSASPASETALQAMNSDSSVFVSLENGWAVFHPAEDPRPDTGLVFYPGANVDYRAYAPVMKLIAAGGYFVVVPPMPLNIAFFDSNAAARAQAAYPEIQDWFIGGHSLGGVVASSYGAIHPDVRGVVLWASAPANNALTVRQSKVILIHATRDGLFNPAMVEDARALLPIDTIYVPVEGGNHSQFGSYGLQKGDNEATIPPEEQWAEIARATVEFMDGVIK